MTPLVEPAVPIEAIDVLNDEFTVSDALGREVLLVAESEDGPVRAEMSNKDPDPDLLRERLARAVRHIGPIRLGPIDADVDLVPLLGALWRAEYPRRPFPGLSTGT